MNRKVFFAALVLLMGLAPKAWAYSGSVTLTGGQTLYYNYVSSSQSITITYPGNSTSNPWGGFTKPTGRIVIPANISQNGTSYPVTQIGAFAFYDCTGLSSLTIPSSVTYIGGNAFYGVVLDTLYNNCQMKLEGGGKMRHLIIGNSVTTIANSAYCGPSTGDTILESVVIGSSVTSIGDHAFRYCKKLDSITIPSTVTSIGMYAFSDCSSLRSVTIPSNSSLGTIGQRAFSGCTSLKIITLPIYMTSIGSYAFYGVRCVIYPGSNFISGSPWGAGCVGKLQENGFVYTNWTKTSLTGYIGEESNVVIPATVTTIEEQAFSGDTSITSVVIPSQVGSIGKDAFKDCTGLTSVTYNASNCQIYGSSNEPTIFQNCPNVTSFTFGDGILQLPGRLFVGLTGLPSIALPEGITYVPFNAFYGCTGLTSVALPSSLTSIQTYAFYGCTSLASLTIPSGVTSIATYAFANCTGLTDLVFNAEIGMYGLFNSNPFYADSNVINITFGCSVIPEGFCSYMSHLQTITIDSNVTTIGASAMNNHSETHYNGTVEQWLAIEMMNEYSYPLDYSHKLYLGDTLVTKLHIPEGVTAISNNFRNDTALTHIYIPSTVTRISNLAFNGCGPNMFRFYAVNPPALGSSSAFLYTQGGNTYGSYMIVPWQSLQAYKTADNYTTFATYLLYPDSCMLSVNVTNPSRGTVTLDGGSTLTHLYQLFDTATISVTLLDADNYSYNVAADGCTIIDTINNNTYKVRLNRNNAYPTFTVNFIGDGYHVDAVANCAGCGTVTGTNDYAYGDDVFVEATPASGYYFVRWADGSTDNPATFVCHGDTTVVAIFSPIVTPELCMVSVQNDRNVLLWDAEDLPIVSYTVYREGSVSGEYEAIATIPYSQAGTFTDTTSRPMSRSYRYRLTATDTCGNESQPSGIHKTMHLTISQGVGSTWNLVWTAYEGAEYTTYVIYRGTSAADIQQIDIMPSAGNTTYSDNAAPAGEVYYQVGVMMTTPCNDATKAATVSRSNIASSSNPGDPEGIDNVDMGNIHIWSADGRILVSGAEGETIRVYDVMGRLVQTFKQSSDQALPAGVYMVKVGNAPARKVVVMQ